MVKNWRRGSQIAQGSIISSLVSTDSDEHHRFRVDYLDVQAAAGHSGIENADYPEVIQSIYFSKEGLLEIVVKVPMMVSALLMCRLIVWCQPSIKATLFLLIPKSIITLARACISFCSNGGAYIKRLMKLPTGVYRAISDNSVYPDFDISDELFDTAVIIG